MKLGRSFEWVSAMWTCSLFWIINYEIMQLYDNFQIYFIRAGGGWLPWNSGEWCNGLSRSGWYCLDDMSPLKGRVHSNEKSWREVFKTLINRSALTIIVNSSRPVSGSHFYATITPTFLLRPVFIAWLALAVPELICWRSRVVFDLAGNICWGSGETCR